MLAPLVQAVEWSIDQCSALDLLAGRTGVADVRPTNDPHLNSEQMVERNSGIYRGQWSWQTEMPELLYEIMQSGEAAKVSPSGFTPLQAACVYADEAIFQALLEAGVPVDARPSDWQQLGYVGDTPLGLLVRFMTPRTAGVRLRMARVLLEKGANPDAPMTTWRGNRVVAVTPFCELGNQDYNHDMRFLLAQAGGHDLARRMAGWQLNWEWFRDDLVQYLTQNGLVKETPEQRALAEKRAQIGRVPLLDLVRKGNVEGVRIALEAGVDIEVSSRAKRYGQEPMFNIPVRRKDAPEAAVEIARLLLYAGSDINALNRRGRSLRVHYNRYRTKASKALVAYLKERGAFLHPDSPSRKEAVAAEEKARQARIQARYRRLHGLPEEASHLQTDSTDSVHAAPVQAETPVAEQAKEETIQPGTPPEQVKETPVQTESIPQTGTALESPPQPPAEIQPSPQVSPEEMQAKLADMQNQLADLEVRKEERQTESAPAEAASTMPQQTQAEK